VHDISDWVVVLGEGSVVSEGTPDQVMADPRVIDAYLGAHHDGAVKTVGGRDASAEDRPAPETGGSEES
jgi:branched-chain amino acid transport system ATP-binding protein